MPTTSNRDLTLTRLNGDVRVTVRYRVCFTERERCLIRCGCRWFVRIVLLGVDPPPGPGGDVVIALGSLGFTVQELPVTAGAGAQCFGRSHTITVPRSALNEDPVFLDSDEIQARIQIFMRGCGQTHTALTDIETLVEGVIQPPTHEEVQSEEVAAEAD